MKRLFKKAAALMLAAAMVMTSIVLPPERAEAAEAAETSVEKDNVQYEKIEGTDTWAVTGLTEQDTLIKAVIADKINGESVVEISDDAFYGEYCLYEIEIPEGITKIGENAFCDSGLTEIKLPESCKTIGTGAFDSTLIEKIHLPKNVESVDMSSLPAYLKEITVAEDNEHYKSIDGVLFSKDGKTLLRYPSAGKHSAYTVPNGTETIGEYAFAYCKNPTFIDLPQTTASIGAKAFEAVNSSYRKMITIVIRNGSCSIGTDVTKNCIATLYGLAESTAESYANGKDDVGFIQLDASLCETEGHQLVGIKELPDCETGGKEKEICLKCDYELEKEPISKSGHQENPRAKNICQICGKAVDEDKVSYVTLNQSVAIRKEDYGTDFMYVLYGFSLLNPGKYKLSISNNSLFESGKISFAKELKNGRLVGAVVDKNMEVVLKVGEKLWCQAQYNDDIDGVEIGISCMHADTEEYTTPAKCEEDGKVETVCTSCGYVFEAETTTIEKTGHSVTESDPVCSNCHAYAEKDSICYKKIAGTDTWAVTGSSDKKITKAVIADKINGESVVEISEDAFYELSDLSEVVILEGIKTIGEYAFCDTGLTEIKLPESCEEIGQRAFNDTAITKLHLPGKIKTIDIKFLPECLQEITVAEDNADYKSVDGVLFSKDDKTLLRYPPAKVREEYTVLNGTETIGNSAFYNTTKLGRVILPDSIKLIEKDAFLESSLRWIDCGNGLETIDERAFKDCENLTFIDLPQSCKTIGNSAFSSYSNKEISIVIRNSSCSIGTDITGDCTATLYGADPSAAKTYAEGESDVTFIVLTSSGCAAGTHQLLTVETVPATCETDGKEKQICLNCDYETKENPVTKLGHQIDWRKNECDRCEKIVDADTIPYVTLQQSVTIKEADFMGDGKKFTCVLYGFSLKKPGTYELSIGDKSLLESGDFSFLKELKNGSLVEAVVDKNMEVVLEEGEKLWCKAVNASGIYGVVIGISCKHAVTKENTTPVTCEEDGKVEKVCTSCDYVFKEETTTIEKMGHSVTESNPVCSNCLAYAEKDSICYKKIAGTDTWAVTGSSDKKITKAVIADKINGESVVEISEKAFYELSDLSEVVILEGIKKIGKYAFGNTGLTEIKLPDSCETIDNAAFDGTAITKLHLPKNVKLIDVIGFPDMLKEITVAEDNADYKSVDGVLFSKDGKTLLRYPPAKVSEEYTVLKDTEKIGERAFYNTTKLGQVILPDSLNLIDNYAFFRSSLYHINCGKNLTTIETEAFSYCDNLKFIDLPQTTTLIGDRAFDVQSGSDKEITIIIRNKVCEIKNDITANRKATLYGTEDSTAKTYAEGKGDVTFIVLTSSGCAAGTHQLLTVETVPATCETDGKEKQICLNCDYETKENPVTKLGHQMDMAKNICSRCMQIVNADTIQYVTLQQSVTIKEADFAENKTIFAGALYGVSLEKPGTYELSISDVSLFAKEIAFVKVPVNGNLRDAISIEDKKVVLKEGEVLWFLATNNPSVYNVEIGILCKHSTTEDKITPATCKENGKVEKVCASCGKVFETTPIEKTAHSFANDKPKCTVCGTPNPNYKPTDPSGSGKTDPQAVSLGKIALSASKVTYNGKQKKPSVTVTDTNGKKVDATNYTVTYSDNTNVGYATVTVTGKNDCTGTLTADFQILPKNTKVAKVTAKKKALTIKWKKQTKQTSGYELQVSTKKNFKGAKKVTVKKNKTTSVTVKKLKAKKKYYVRIRTYKTVKMNGKSKKLYSNWSKAVNKKTK